MDRNLCIMFWLQIQLDQMQTGKKIYKFNTSLYYEFFVVQVESSSYKLFV